MKNSITCLVLFALAFTTPVLAEVKLHSLFSDNMVLQRDKPVPVWGTANPNEKIAVSIGTQSKNTQADADGKWLVTLDPMPAGTDQTLSVKGDNEITLKNVAIGDVYLCSGQSNMAFGVNFFGNPAQEDAAANYPNIRLFTVPMKIAGTPQREIAAPTQWQVCTPGTTLQFSATAYYFGREMHKKLDVPVGLIASAVGGTHVAAWISRSDPGTVKAFAERAKGTLPEQMKTWWAANDPGTKNNWGAPAFDDAKWKTVKVPGAWQKNEIGGNNQVVWFRRQIDIPAAWAGKDVVLNLGQIGDRDTTYFNGEEVADMSTFVWYQKHIYKIPGSMVKAGPTTIAVGVLNTGTGSFAGMTGPAMDLELAGDATQKIDLAGDWKYQLGPDQKDMQPPPPFTPDVTREPNQQAVLYNGMIAPLVPFAVRATIWYQGESDAPAPTPYQTVFPELISEWRTAWGAKPDGSDFGFYFVQLPNFNAPPGQDWPGLREAQAMALKLPHTGMITTIDIGDPGNIHPGDKQDVGKRLGLVVLANEFGQKVEYSGPTFAAIKIGGNKARIEFSHAQGLKTTDAAAPKGFSIQGQDDKWYPATAQIEGEAVVVSSDQAPNPKAVRYAWENNPAVNLVNAAGLPATPFRSQ